MVIPVYTLTWHLTQSPSSRELLISSLSPYMQFEQFGWEGDGDLFDFQKEWLTVNPIIFYQTPPPKSIYNHPELRVIYIPMWDEVRGYDMEWWRQLPKSWRVVSFSNEISQRARAVGLNTLDVRYYMSPAECEQADWSKQRVLFYWNRTGMVGKSFLRKLCRALEVDVLLFRRRIDPKQRSWCDYKLPKKLGMTFVKELTFDGADAHQEYLKYLNQANIFIAPRLSEGVGLSFIEALARGCAVFAYDAPTMNEYITHKTNGYLLQHSHHQTVINTMQEQLTKQLHRVARRCGYQNIFLGYPVTQQQNWAEIKELDLQALGNKARQLQFEGYSAWRSIIPQYASFILDWE